MENNDNNQPKQPKIETPKQEPNKALKQMGLNENDLEPSDKTTNKNVPHDAQSNIPNVVNNQTELNKPVESINNNSKVLNQMGLDKNDFVEEIKEQPNKSLKDIEQNNVAKTKLDDLDIEFDFHNDFNERDGFQDKSFFIRLDGKPVVLNSQSEDSAFNELQKYLKDKIGMDVSIEELKNFKNNQKSSVDLIANSGLTEKEIKHSGINPKSSPKRTQRMIEEVKNKIENINNNLQKYPKDIRNFLKRNSYYLLSENIDESQIRYNYEKHKRKWIDDRYNLDTDLQYEMAENEFEEEFGTKDEFLNTVLSLLNK